MSNSYRGSSALQLANRLHRELDAYVEGLSRGAPGECPARVRVKVLVAEETRDQDRKGGELPSHTLFEVE